MRQKIRHLGLEVVEQNRSVCTTTSIVMPKDFPSVEEALKDLVEARTPLYVIAKKLGVSEESVRAKIRRLGCVFWEIGCPGNWSFVVVGWFFIVDGQGILFRRQFCLMQLSKSFSLRLV